MVLIVAIILMTIGSFGVGAATFMEMKHREPKWALMMKIFPWVFGIGAVILGIAIAGS